ncbi:MAG: NAD(P)-dependent glycerol-3-phosphate dehydrogenase [Alphaproteobacteria bacterium]|nr:NAD(P)-dependent glycerol-3-phosphate dehydrogenase [Alphaproteobacteria bacterium]
MPTSGQRVGVIGAGAWGTAMATVAHRARCKTIIRAHEAEVVEAINTQHINPDYLPGIPLDPAITATGAYTEAASADIILLATPTQFARATVAALAPHLADGTPVVICSKGIEQETGKLLSEAISETAPNITIAVLSGPTFADEVARGLPTAVTLACENLDVANGLAEALGTPTFRPYMSGDVVGAQIGGAVKNVIAIACGIIDGRGLGQNARAATIARGLAELARFGDALNIDPRTLMGLSGLGDLTLTCTSVASRNYAVGKALGEGATHDDVMGNRRSVAEGVFTAPAVLTRAKALGVELPICAAVDTILHNNADIDVTIADVLSRPYRPEH